MKIRFMLENTVYTLKSNMPKIYENYCNDDSDWISSITGTKENFGTYGKDFSDFELVYTGNTRKDDLKNMKLMYDNLKSLSDSQAGDERLWAGLAHTYFWNYMQKRWSLPEKKDKVDFIKGHYFFKHGNIRSLLTNGLSRLWWYARLTYDEDNINNPYELTEYLADDDLNGKGFVLFGANFSNNKRLCRSFLYIIKNYEEAHNLKISRQEFDYLVKYMVKIGGKILLDYLSDDNLKNLLVNKMNILVRNRRGCQV